MKHCDIKSFIESSRNIIGLIIDMIVVSTRAYICERVSICSEISMYEFAISFSSMCMWRLYTETMWWVHVSWFSMSTLFYSVISKLRIYRRCVVVQLVCTQTYIICRKIMKCEITSYIISIICSVYNTRKNEPTKKIKSLIIIKLNKNLFKILHIHLKSFNIVIQP